MEDKYLVFIVDDEPIFLQMLIDELSEDERLEIQSFKSGEECLDKLYLQPDIVILDHILSKGNPHEPDGLEILEEIQNENPDTQVIILSGQTFPDVTFDYIIKKDVAKYIVKGENAFEIGRAHV